MKTSPLRSMWVKTFIQIFILMALPIVVVTYFATHISQSTLIEQKRQSDLGVLHALSSNLSTLLESVEMIGQIVVADEDVKDFLREALSTAYSDRNLYYIDLDASSVLRGYLAADILSAVSLLNMDGMIVGEQILCRRRLSWNLNPTFMERVQDDVPTWSYPMTIEFIETGETVRAMSVLNPVVDNDALLGFVVLHIDTYYIQRLLADKADEIFVLDSSDIKAIVASPFDIPFFEGFYSVRRINYRLLREDSSVIVSSDGQQMIVTTMMHPQSHLQLVLVSSFDDIHQEIEDQYPSFFIIGVLALAFSIVAASVIAITTVSPVIRLEKVMQRVMKGDSSVRYKVTSKDEIAALGITFNSLLDEIYIEQELKRNMQLQMIQEQVRPHFLYNILEMVSSLIRDGMHNEALTSILGLAKFYRISLNNGYDIIRIEQDIELLEIYLQLQRLRYTEFMDFTLSFHPSIMSYNIPKLTLQPIIENAIYHGLKSSREKGLLCVVGYKEYDQIVFEIYDNGKGMDEEELAKASALLTDPDNKEAENHFGLASVSKRLNLFSGGKATLRIESEKDKYTNVTISFPVDGGYDNEKSSDC